MAPMLSLMPGILPSVMLFQLDAVIGALPDAALDAAHVEQVALAGTPATATTRPPM